MNTPQKVFIDFSQIFLSKISFEKRQKKFSKTSIASG